MMFASIVNSLPIMLNAQMWKEEEQNTNCVDLRTHMKKKYFSKAATQISAQEIMLVPESLGLTLATEHFLD
jgi:hypothetical protein